MTPRPRRNSTEVPSAAPPPLGARGDQLARLRQTGQRQSCTAYWSMIVSSISAHRRRAMRPEPDMLGLGSIGLRRSLRELQIIDRVEIVGGAAANRRPVVDFDVASIFQEADEAPDPRCNVRLIYRLLRRIPVAPAPVLLEPPNSPIVDRADRNPMQFQPMQEMAGSSAKQNRTG
ncbi:MAG: hypothetical protein IPN48_10120 [Sphingomonadales bacterium]|nr:hypothetical protein [Sphingomonadales bacterium]